MRVNARRTGVIIAVVGALVASLTLSVAATAESTGWKGAVALIPSTPYTRDAQTAVRMTGEALRLHLTDDLGARRLDPVLADVKTRYFDGARLRDAAQGEAAYDNFQHLASYLESRVSGGGRPHRRGRPGARRGPGRVADRSTHAR